MPRPPLSRRRAGNGRKGHGRTMATEEGDAGQLVLSPRAGIAMLTLQLRAAEREAEVAEAAAADLDRAHAELEERLELLLIERRRTYADEIAQARARSERTLAEARAARSAESAESAHSNGGPTAPPMDATAPSGAAGNLP